MRTAVRTGGREPRLIDHDDNAVLDVAERAVRTLRLLHAFARGAAVSKPDRKWELSFVPGDAEPRDRHPAIRASCSRVPALPPPGAQIPGMQQITQADEVDYLKAVSCIRTHGFPSVPDPTFTGSGVHISVPKTDENSPSFQRAVATCRKLIPAGLPYSG